MINISITIDNKLKQDTATELVGERSWPVDLVRNNLRKGLPYLSTHTQHQMNEEILRYCTQLLNDRANEFLNGCE